MNAIESSFPDAQNLLCQWHIQKNLLAKCKRYFPTEELDASNIVSDSWSQFQRTWTAVVRTQTSEEFDEAWRKMKKIYRQRIFAIQYIETVWLPWKERFACPWTDKHRHYGTIVTSRVESAHAAIKRYLEVCIAFFENCT